MDIEARGSERIAPNSADDANISLSNIPMKRALREFSEPVIDDTNSPCQQNTTESEKSQSNNTISEARRQFQGNFNYVDLYNRESTEFFTSIREFSSIKRFRPSYISVHGDVTYMMDTPRTGDGGSDDEFSPDDESTSRDSGSLWSPIEKEIFFNYLARFSIHRSDLIADKLPSKSELEIINYYELLKEDLRLLQNRKRRFKKLIKITDIPLSFEMSESFIRMEESQAEQMSIIERVRNNDTNQRDKGKLNRYIYKDIALLKKSSKSKAKSRILDRRNSVVAGSGRKYAAGITTRHSESTEDGGGANSAVDDNAEETHSNFNKDSLIDFSKACDLSETLYMKNRVTKPLSMRLMPKLSMESIKLLEDLIKQKTRELLSQIVQNKMTAMLVNKHTFDIEQEEMKIIVNKPDILRAAAKVSVSSDTSSWGNYANLKDYYRELPKRLDIEVIDGSEVLNEEKLNKILSKKIRRFDSVVEESDVTETLEKSSLNSPLKNSKSTRLTNPEFVSPSDIESEFEREEVNESQIEIEIDSDSEASSEVEFEREGTVVHISNLKEIKTQNLNLRKYNKNSNLEESNDFIEDDDEYLIDNPIAEKLFNIESEQLDEFDLEKSRNYEHVLLTWLSTNNNPVLQSTENAEQYLHTIEADRQELEADAIEASNEASENINGSEDEGEYEAGLSEEEITSEMLLSHMYDFARYH